MSTELSDDELIQRFEEATLPAEMFHHRQHVRAGWLYVTRYGMPNALDTFSRALQRFADAKGAHHLFHVTITWAYLLLINERQAACAAPDWEAFAARNQDLLMWKPSILDAYYTADTLWSARARHTFLMPDRAALQRGLLNARPVPAGDTSGASRVQAGV
jgi:hypothetical protein